MRTICSLLAGAGARVRVLGTTASEHGAGFDSLEHLHRAGLEPVFETGPRKGTRLGVIRVQDGPLDCTLVHTPGQRAGGKDRAWEGDFDRALDRLVARRAPQVVLTFGGHAGDSARLARLRNAGAVTVFGLRNLAYFRWAFEHVDAVLTPSAFVSERYRREIGLVSTALPTPIEESETIAASREPVFFTFVNPSMAKGVMFFAALAERLGTMRPDIPLLVIESRGTAGTLVRAGAAGGYDLRRHASIHISPGVARPAEIFAATRVLLAPSAWEEPSGRVAAEALVNGLPAIVSDRGGLAETCAGAGVVLPLPAELTPSTPCPPPIDHPAVQAWGAAIEHLADDEDAYREACRRAETAGLAYRSSSLAPRYAEFFGRVQRTAGVIDLDLRSAP
jgi:glycosyltransferase involved in cell wall biosynthesis